ncbi:ADP-ribosylglycohydrolase family protein [Agromyces sp. PvR057]|uniref:ADP-ribosylglycohydrolase family protein n=1 Tax=Agromyces sp. PvR057 TaxID=3156403 RepID=UPI003398EC8E
MLGRVAGAWKYWAADAKDVDGPEQTLADAARRVSELTHFEMDAGDACVIWSLAIRHAIRTGSYGLRTAIDALLVERRARWHEFIDVAERTQPATSSDRTDGSSQRCRPPGSAIRHAELAGEGLQQTLERRALRQRRGHRRRDRRLGRRPEAGRIGRAGVVAPRAARLARAAGRRLGTARPRLSSRPVVKLGEGRPDRASAEVRRPLRAVLRRSLVARRK